MYMKHTVKSGFKDFIVKCIQIIMFQFTPVFLATSWFSLFLGNPGKIPFRLCDEGIMGGGGCVLCPVNANCLVLCYAFR